MKEILHIFRKDVRHFWPHISALVLLMAVFTVFDILRSPITDPENRHINATAGLLKVAVPLCWWYLIAALIHEEALPGDKQFWITRPYSWKDLFGAKLLFVLAFINLPLLISSCFILGLQGFPVVSNLPALMIAQIPTSALFLVTAFAFAALTHNMGQFVFAWFLVLLALVLPPMFSVHSGMGAVVFDTPAEDDPLPTLLLFLAVFMGLILWQYATRRTGQSRVALAVLVLLVLPGLSFLPRGNGFKVDRPTTRRQLEISKTQLAYDLTDSAAAAKPKPGTTPAWVTVALPVRVSEIPADVSLEGFSRDCKIELPDGRLWNTGWNPVAWLQRQDDNYWQEIRFEAAKFNLLKSETITLTVSMDLTAITNRVVARIPVRQGNFGVPNLGICRIVDEPYGPYVMYRAGMRQPQRTLVRIEYPGYQSEEGMTGSNSSGRYPFIWGVSPVEKWVISFVWRNGSDRDAAKALRHPDAELVFIPRHPVFHFKRELTARNVHLSDYVASPSR